jgi:outer membrane receptor protein involved in Fe transport
VGKHSFFLLVLGFLLNNVDAQILNIDREFAADSLRKNWDLSGGLNFSSDKQKKNISDLNTSLEFDRFLKNKYVLLGIFKNDLVFSGKSKIQNVGMFHVRYRDNDQRKLSYELYTQYQWNGAWGMEYRYLYGSNLRLKFFDKNKSDFYAGLGVFHENEKWNWSGVADELQIPNAESIKRKMYRVNTYLKSSFKLSKAIDFSVLTYLQIPINSKFKNSRWYLDANLYFRISEKFNFFVHWDHITDAYRVVPIKTFYYSYSTGLMVNL